MRRDWQMNKGTLVGSCGINDEWHVTSLKKGTDGISTDCLRGRRQDHLATVIPLFQRDMVRYDIGEMDVLGAPRVRNSCRLKTRRPTVKGGAPYEVLEGWRTFFWVFVLRDILLLVVGSSFAHLEVVEFVTSRCKQDHNKNHSS